MNEHRDRTMPTGVVGGFEAAAFNQTPPFENIDLFSTDLALREALARSGIDSKETDLAAFGRDFGSTETMRLGRLANENPPRLKIVDAVGDRIDEVEFHPAYHALLAKSMAAGLHSPVTPAAAHFAEGRKEAIARAARLYMATQIEAGHICPLTMTRASAAALSASPEIGRAWLPHLGLRDYDGAPKPWFAKRAVTLGMGMTERQGGTDVRSNITVARRLNTNGPYEIEGHKWFLSAPMSDAFIILAQTEAGLTAFLVPRFCPDGRRNGLRFQRLKDKLGNRSNASTEVEFQRAYAERLGDEGEGLRVILPMVQETRLDCAVASAGQMRFGLAQAMHHGRHRKVFGHRLVEQPAMRAVLADLALESEGNIAVVFRLVRAWSLSGESSSEAAYARLMTPAVKYLVTKMAPTFITEALECLGGNGYVEDLPMARLYREAPLNAIWEGSGTVVALDVRRVLQRERESSFAVVDALAKVYGAWGKAARSAIEQGLAEGEGRVRLIAETLARLAAFAAMAEADSGLAEAYASARLQGGSHTTFGTCDLEAFETLLLPRILPD